MPLRRSAARSAFRQAHRRGRSPPPRPRPVSYTHLTLPWHWLGLQGQWRRVANFNYADPIIAGWGPWVLVSLGGGLLLLVSALLLVRNLAVAHRGAAVVLAKPLYALAVHPPQRVPAALNGFALWNVLVLVLMLLAYGFPIAQFLVAPSPTAIVHRI